MKSQHFCTKELLEKLLNKDFNGFIDTYRTGWIGQFKVNEVVKLNQRDTVPDIFICNGKVLINEPIRYKNIPNSGKKECERYGKKFHLDDWFFHQRFQIIRVETKAEKTNYGPK